MKDYFYCEHCDDLIHKDGICLHCMRCDTCGSDEIIHTNDVESQYEYYKRVRELEEELRGEDE